MLKLSVSGYTTSPSALERLVGCETWRQPGSELWPKLRNKLPHPRAIKRYSLMRYCGNTLISYDRRLYICNTRIFWGCRGQEDVGPQVSTLAIPTCRFVFKAQEGGGGYIAGVMIRTSNFQ